MILFVLNITLDITNVTLNIKPPIVDPKAIKAPSSYDPADKEAKTSGAPLANEIKVIAAIVGEMANLSAKSYIPVDKNLSAT